MRRIPSGSTDQQISFEAAPGLSGFSVERSRNGAAFAAMTTPTVTERATASGYSVYWLLLDEDTTIGASSIFEQMTLIVEAAGMQPIRIDVELVGIQQVDVQQMNGTELLGTGTSIDKWRG